MQTKTIFILGNGFDLAHYLPTAYIHFMEAMMVIENSEVDSALNFADLFASRIGDKNWFFKKTIELYKTDKLILPIDKVNELREKLQNNGWFQHFKNHLSKTEMTWIDFESEINNVLLAFKEVMSLDFDKTSILNSQMKTINYQNHVFDVNSDEILDKTNKLLSDMFFVKTNLQSDYYWLLLSNFNIIQSIYFSVSFIHHFRSHIEVKDYSLLSEIEFTNFQVIERSNGFDKFIDVADKFEKVIHSRYLRKFSNVYLSFNEDEIFKKLSDDLSMFNNIFAEYISQVINKLEPKKPFFPFGDLNNDIYSVYTFNYSDTFERLYPNAKLHYEEIQYVHGNAEDKNIVLGISDLPNELKPHKIYSFVKTFQKIINRTDYEFISHHDVALQKEHKYENQYDREFYEIIVWGHSLDISDEEYIKEIFKLNNELSYNFVKLEVWFHEKPHDSLANLMNIMGKEVIQEWIKRGWLWLKTPAPDVYSLNNRR